MAKTPKTTTTPETSTPDAAPSTTVDATADAAGNDTPPAAVTGGDFVPGVDGGPPTATPIVNAPAAPPPYAADPAAPEVIADAAPVVASGPPCASCGQGVEKDRGFATEGLFMAVTEKTEIETVHASNHVTRKIRNFHFNCAGQLIERAVDGDRAL